MGMIMDVNKKMDIKKEQKIYSLDDSVVFKRNVFSFFWSRVVRDDAEMDSTMSTTKLNGKSFDKIVAMCVI
jgi:hypothetical protein